MRFKKIPIDGDSGRYIIDTGLPQKSIKPIGLNLLADIIRGIFTAMADVQNLRNGVVLAMCEGLVNVLFDMSKRDEVLELVATAKTEELGEDGGASLDHAERTAIITSIWIRYALRGATEHMDEAFAISHRTSIGTFGGTDEPDDADDADMHEEWRTDAD